VSYNHLTSADDVRYNASCRYVSARSSLPTLCMLVHGTKSPSNLGVLLQSGTAHVLARSRLIPSQQSGSCTVVASAQVA
jgi:hypothetical protein